jgi:hypothetical protein
MVKNQIWPKKTWPTLWSGKTARFKKNWPAKKFFVLFAGKKPDKI